ncbi:MAG TPA: Ig-like domain repeat protein [Streptosporangiaceae bacterium]|nr:Ig-like domain repeat protein [Streptosporangiaceae bacterium]
MRQRGRLASTGIIAVLAAAGYQFAAAATASAAPGVATTTTLTASPATVTTGATVTLTADVAAADSTTPAGSVQFEAGGTDIGTPAAVTGGVASATTTFAAGGAQALSAVFIPATAAYLTSAGTFTEAVNVAGSVPLATTVPQSGTFTVTITPGTVNLAVAGLTATGTLEDITVTDTRNYYPGWSGTGQESAFTGSGTAIGSTISGGQLGWVPTAVETLQDGASLGSHVAPVSPGLGSTAATLALAPPGCGVGTNVLSASLTLDIPAAAAAGPYLGSMTITFMTAGPQDEVCAVIPISG